ncbi:uncharacterized protein DUF3895 [Aneurinibacillus soli]|uniref:Competence protein CoiA-like family protein n=1 Tax=Aneurinibacillus soli TaxID=1500254 RepID=A0A0U5BFH5_9BACL|nr:competence protein CoiA family protein [Aneurinibacillus soli]PYE61923.1 uncharacterized protein DUF3895 [Aneurinibacillus soli]BAU29740.1 Competence protein CoiA-like family protein [Aneurinibacillus soli]
MFSAVTKEGHSVNCIHNSEDWLRQLTNVEKRVICPECKEQMVFRAGRLRRAHFAHQPKVVCTYPYYEPETKEHLEGKLLLYNKLRGLFPKSQVEIEHRIEETNQRSDVIVIHPDGEKWAFEFQCYKISGEAWLQRHRLYKKAGIKDFWVLGDSIHRYGKTDHEEDKEKHRLVELEQVIYKHTAHLHYINTEQKIFRYIKNGDLDTTLLYYPTELIIPLQNVTINKQRWWSREIELLYIKEEAERKRKEEEKRQEQERKQTEIEQARQRYKAIVQERRQLTKSMTEKEKMLFLQLCQKHQFTSQNFPGLFHAQTNYSELIATPVQLWKLWIYNEFIYQKRGRKLWMPEVTKRFLRLKDKGMMRLGKYSKDPHFSFAFYSFVHNLEQIHMLARIDTRGKYYFVVVDELPIYHEEKQNAIITMGIEETLPYELYRNDSQIPQFYSDFLQAIGRTYEEAEITDEKKHFAVKAHSSNVFPAYQHSMTATAVKTCSRIKVSENEKRNIHEEISGLSDMEKQAVKHYLKQGTESAKEITENLISEHGASSARYEHTGKYRLYPFVCQYLDFLVGCGLVTYKGNEKGERFYRWVVYG